MNRYLLLFASATVLGCTTPLPKSDSNSPSTETPSAMSIYEKYLNEAPPERASASLFNDPAKCPSLGRKLKLGEECIRANEVEYYKNLAGRLRAVQARLPLDKKNQADHNIAGGIRRTFHAKGHACVKALVTPIEKRSSELRAGVFKADTTRPAWVRFSNGTGIVQSDIEKDARGFALKILGVAQDKAQKTVNQDFLLTNKPKSTARNAEAFVEFAEANAEGPVKVITSFAPTHFPEFRAIFEASRKKVDSMARESFWAGGAFSWGRRADGLTRAVKLRVSPCANEGPQRNQIPDWLKARVRPENPAPDYLKSDLVEILGTHELCFVMTAQVQRDVSKQPIEDAFEVWKVEETAELPLARIIIPAQKFDTDEQNGFCERLTFNPWNGLAEHRPLGDLNRARRFAYAASQDQRLQALSDRPGNAVPDLKSEPQFDDIYWNLNPLSR